MVIYQYIADKLENVNAANKLADKVWDTVYSLKTFPNRYQLAIDDIRKVPIGRYNIYYSVNEQSKRINILHILYQGRDISQIVNW